jgi:hypothetical protein
MFFRKPALAGSMGRATATSAKTAHAMLKPIRRFDIDISAAPITLRHAPDPISGAASLSFIRRREASRLAELKHTRKSSGIEEKTQKTPSARSPRVVTVMPTVQVFTSGFGQILACHIVGHLHSKSPRRGLPRQGD